MGIIYRIAFPNGKSYIGQTIRTLNERLNDHKHGAESEMERGCRVLYAAIRKYGWDNLKFETLIECADHQLDDYERQFIAFYGTMADDGWGYNLESGGSNGKTFSKITREKMRQSQLARDPRPFKKKDETKGFPAYMQVVKGYVCILKHPKCSWKSFKDPMKNYEENLADAFDYYAKIESGEIIHETKDLPMGIYRREGGYRVHVKYAGRVWTKTFAKQKFSDEERLAQAMDYLERVREIVQSIKDAEKSANEASGDDKPAKLAQPTRGAVQRLDGGGGGKDENIGDAIVDNLAALKI